MMAETNNQTQQAKKQTNHIAEVSKMDLISRQAAIDGIEITPFDDYGDYMRAKEIIENLPPAEPEIIRCKDCKHNPEHTWFECPMSHLTEKQRPETAWCWKGERRSNG